MTVMSRAVQQTLKTAGVYIVHTVHFIRLRRNMSSKLDIAHTK